MTLSKPWYKSSTIQSAISAYVILLANTGVALYEDGTFREPTTTEVSALIAGAVALKETIAGRRRATEAIGNSVPPPIDMNVYPEFSNISELPSVEYANIVPDSPIEDTLDSVDNEEEDTLDIDFSKLEGKYYLIAQVDTKLKTSTTQASELPPGEYREVGQWQRIDIDSWSLLSEKNEHIGVRIDEYNSINDGKFYAYAPHFKLFNVFDKEIEIEAPTSPIPVIPKDRGREFNLPGNTSKFYTKDPIYPGSHFSWGEATKNATRIPTTQEIVDSIINQARELDKFRAFVGVPLVVTSWYRDPRSNAAVGGASRSSHLTGKATDIVSPSMPARILEAKAMEFWKIGGIGRAANKKNPFVHLASDGWYRTWFY